LRFDDRRIDAPAGAVLSKVPQITLAFWVIKVLATTLGETGGDALSMTLELGYAASTLIFLAFFVLTLTPQFGSKRYHPFLYWAVVVATTTVGTTMPDYLDRTLTPISWRRARASDSSAVCWCSPACSRSWQWRTSSHRYRRA
jgi:uncharacterized membrane-anchored protein